MLGFFTDLVFRYTAVAVESLAPTPIDTTPHPIPPSADQIGNITLNKNWFFVRVLVKLANAVIEQSKNAESPTQRAASMIGYCVSSFAAICMTTAILLNRIMVFASNTSASPRNRPQLPAISNVVLRLMALYLLFAGSYGTLVAMKVKSADSSNPILRFLLSSSYFDYDYNTFKNKSFLGLKYLSKSFLDFSTETDAHLVKCPSPSVLKPLYISLCLGHILETFIAAINGTDPLAENGLTLFEYSLAFQEIQTAKEPSFEVLVIALVAVLNQIVIQIIELFHLNEYRLIPSSVIGISMIFFYAVTVFNGRIQYFPFSTTLSYLPQLIISCIIVICVLIFLLAALFKGSFSGLELSKVKDNLSSINVLMTDDFYTAQTNVGQFMLTAAGQASYIKEISEVQVSMGTWVENENASRAQRFSINRFSGYDNQVAVSPELEEMRVRNARSKNMSGKWIMAKRLEAMAGLLTNLKQLLVSLLITRKKPHYLQQSQNKTDTSNTPDEADFTLLSDDEEDLDYIMEVDALNADSENDEDDESIEELPLEQEEENYGTNQGLRYISSHIPLLELISSPEDLINIVTIGAPQEEQQQRHQHQHNLSTLGMPPIDQKILMAHLQRNDSSLMTRAQIYKADPTIKLLSLIAERRMNAMRHSEYDNDDLADSDLPPCVICHTNQREIILWPCKCLAICEACRISLTVRGFNDCVCCRRKVEAYSKVFVP